MAEETKIAGASVALFDGDRVLLVLRGREPMADLWSLPGGKLKVGESAIDAAIREVTEETALQITSLVFVQTFIPLRTEGTKVIESNYHLDVFASNQFSGNLVASDDAKDVKWVQLSNLSGLPLTPHAEEIIHNAHKALLTQS